jgi:transposase
MGYIKGEARGRQTLFPVALDDLIPADHFGRVIDSFVGRLDFQALGFERAEAAETGRPGYDPRDLMKLYLYGYLQQIRSSRRLEAECRGKVEVIWLLGRLAPDHKSIAEFRRLHRKALTEAGAESVRFARSVGLVRGEWVAIDGSKFQAVTSARSVAERESMKRYLDAVEAGDEQDELVIDPGAVAAALEKLKSDAEPEARFMRMGQGHGYKPAYNVQTAVDAEHALIIAHQVTTETNDQRSLLPMAEAAQKALDEPPSLNVVADSGYSNAAQAEVCSACALKSRCTQSPQRYVYLHLQDAAMERAGQRATAAVMRLRRCTVEHPFGTLKYRIFGNPRLLLRGVGGAQTEISLGTMAYNLKRMINVLGGLKPAEVLQG